MYKARIKDKNFEIDSQNGQLFLDNEAFPISLIPIGHGAFKVMIANEELIADIVRIDVEQKQVVLRIKNKRYTVNIQEPIDLMIEQLGVNIKKAKKVNNLKAPMPGLVTKLLVSEGDEVKQGEPLLILEAMKMENVFKAASDVKIKALRVTERQAVDKGEELIAFE